MQLRRSGALLATSLSISMAIGFSVFVACAPGGLAPAAYAADAATVSAEDFLKSYYTAMSKVKGPKDIEPFLSEKVKGKMPADDISDPKMVALFLEMIHSTQPTKVKVVSKKEEKDRVVFDLLPDGIPSACADMAKSKNFSMKGSAIVVNENGQWKIYKDHWVAESKDENGNQKISFGTDPDKESSRDSQAMGSGDASMPQDYESKLRDCFMQKWKQTGTGKSIYVSMKLTPDGSITDLQVRGEKPQKTAEDQVRKLIEESQPLPALPDDMKTKPYAWMMFDWQDEGRCISGPYLQEKVPDWVNEKLGTKSAAAE